MIRDFLFPSRSALSGRNSLNDSRDSLLVDVETLFSSFLEKDLKLEVSDMSIISSSSFSDEVRSCSKDFRSCSKDFRS